MKSRLHVTYYQDVREEGKHDGHMGLFDIAGVGAKCDVRNGHGPLDGGRDEAGACAL